MTTILQVTTCHDAHHQTTSLTPVADKNADNGTGTCLPLNNSNSRVVSVSVVLTQIEPGDSSAVFSLGVSATRRAMSGLACTAAGVVLAGHMGASTLVSCRCSSKKCSSNQDTIDHCCSRCNIRQKGQTRARRLLANRNGLRHFGLEFVTEDGAVYTLEKLVQGVVLYAGTSSRKNHCHVWSVPLDGDKNDETRKTLANKKALYLSDLQQICQDENSCPYSFFGNNCKRLTWTVLTRILSSQTLLEFENVRWSNHPIKCHSDKNKANFSYTKFRDTCQSIDMEMMLLQRKKTKC